MLHASLGHELFSLVAFGVNKQSEHMNVRLTHSSKR